jgi:hypothetical protein
MHKINPPESDENQEPIDLETGCRWCTLTGSSIRLLVPTREASVRLERTLDIPGRLAFVRNLARQGIGDSEIFAQKSFVVQVDPDALLIVTISMLITQHAWRGGWFMSSVPNSFKSIWSKGEILL